MASIRTVLVVFFVHVLFLGVTSAAGTRGSADAASAAPECHHDVGVTAILAPVGVIDSGVTVVPRAVVRNFGGFTDTVPVTFRVGSYTGSAQVILRPGRSDTVEFSPLWVAQPVGRLATLCYTRLWNDAVRCNDTCRGLVEVVARERHDVGALAVLAPVGVTDSGTVITPRAVITNFGTGQEQFPVTFTISPVYADSTTRSLAPGQTDTVSFADWVAQPVGRFEPRCQTGMESDEDRSNDTTVAEDSVTVVRCRHDVGAVEILAPVGTVDSGTVVVPRAVLHNFGDREDTFPATFRIGTTYSQTLQWILSAGATDTVAFADWTAEPVGRLAMVCFTGLGRDCDRTNDTVDGWVDVAAPRYPDVGAVSVVWPTGLVDSGTTAPPRALIANFGNRSETFQTTFTIGAIYRDSIVMRLAAGETTEVSFSSWVARPVGHHVAFCYTQLADDRNRANDTVRTELCVIPPTPVRHDVGAVEILAPAGSIVLGTDVTPRAWVANFGDSTEVFPVTFEIGAGYTATVTCTLTPARTATVSFPIWTATPLGLQPTACYTGLAPDSNRANDTITGSVEVTAPPRHDVATISIVTPADTVDSGTVQTPSAVVTNLGTVTETFPVSFAVGSVYAQTLPAVTLNPGDTTTLYFPSWTAMPGSHATICYTELTADDDRSNDTVRGSVAVRPPMYDVGAVRILAPADTVDSGTVITPVAIIHRFADSENALEVTFPVTMAIGGTYRRTEIVTMPARGVDTVQFPTTWLAQPPGAILCTCYTNLFGDPNRSNDTAHGVVVVVRPPPPPLHDVSVEAIMAPTGVVDSGTVVVPRAVVRNRGTYAEDFPVTFRISTGYTHTVSRSLLPGDDDTVDFMSWVAAPVGEFETRCYTELASDENRFNDTVVGVVAVAMVERHDVGAVRIIAPAGIIDSGTTHTPRVVVHNFGRYTDTFPVTFRISDGYRDSTRVALAPGELDTVDFAAWTAMWLGRYETRSYTSLLTDQNRANDTVVGDDSVTIRHVTRHDVGTPMILAPQGVVESGAVLSPEAAVFNYGDEPEQFLVTFRIGTSYTQSVWRTLLPNQLENVLFPFWTATGPDTQATICFTSLANDTNRANDTAYGTVVLQPDQPVFDASVEAIIAPAGVVESGSAHTPTARVRNLGTRTEDIPVTFIIGSTWRESTRVRVDPATSATVIFPHWVADSPGPCSTLCYTNLVPDVNRANDTARGAVSVNPLPGPDVGCELILSPNGVADSGTTVVPRAVVHYYPPDVPLDRSASPLLDLTFPVTMRIGLSYTHTVDVTLPGYGDSTISFPTWTAHPLGPHACVAYTSLANDPNRANDTAAGSVQVTQGPRHDVAARAILSPAGDLHVGASVIPVAVVRNQGTRDATFPVTMVIGSSYLGAVEVGPLHPDQADTVTFPAWNAGPVGVQSVTLYTSLALDENRRNDTLSSAVRVSSADASVVLILQPAGTADSGALLTPRAVVKNFGPGAADFPVTMVIGATYRQTVPASLGPDASDTLDFPAWAADLVGVQNAVCYTSLDGDPNPANDTAASRVEVVAPVHDIGVDAVLAPVGQATVIGPPWTAPVSPRCRVRSYSTTTEAGFDVRCRILSGRTSGAGDTTWTVVYDRTELVSWTLPPGGSFELTFPDTVLGYNTYLVRCSTSMVGDGNAANDYSVAGFTVGSRVGGPEQVSLKIYTRAGECVRHIDQSVTAASPPWVLWDRTNDNGRRVAAGIYLCVVSRAGGTDEETPAARAFNVLVKRDADEVRVMWRQP